MGSGVEPCSTACYRTRENPGPPETEWFGSHHSPNRRYLLGEGGCQLGKIDSFAGSRGGQQAKYMTCLDALKQPKQRGKHPLFQPTVANAQFTNNT